MFDLMSNAKPGRITVILIDDEADLVDLLAYRFGQIGFDVVKVTDSRRALSVAKEVRPDVIILDAMMPEPSGFRLLPMFKAEVSLEKTMVLMLSAAAEGRSKIKGLSLGADDYLPKPFDFKELELRVRALVRRSNPSGAKREILTNGDLSVDLDRHQVLFRGESVHLTALEFKLLLYLLRNMGFVAKREQLLDHVWGYPAEMKTRLVDVTIRRMRGKFGADFHMIETIRGVGYRVSSASMYRI